MERIFKFWFLKVSRGYSVPMSITNWLVVFILALANNGNIFFGILALIGFVFAHLGTNVFDDVVDEYFKVPKQKYKSTHLENGETNLKTILILAIVYFAIALLIGGYLFLKMGFPVLILAVIGGVIALLYPKLNNFALGELAVGLTFGPLLFAGIYFVMTGNITSQVIFVSIPVAIFTIFVLMIHALMDYDFDIKSGKKTFAILAGNKNTALNLIFLMVLAAYILTIVLVFCGYLPKLALIIVFSGYNLGPLYRKMKIYNKNSCHDDLEFIKNFASARNTGTIYCLCLSLALVISYLIN